MTRRTWCAVIVAMAVGASAHAFDPGNIRYEFPCKASTEDRPEFARAEFDDSQWPDLKTFQGRQYQVEHLVPPGIILWNRIHLKVGAESKGKDLALVIEDGQVLADAFLNGTPLPSCWGAGRPPPRRTAFALPPELIRRDGTDVLALRYYNFPMPREDTLGRVELREAEPMDRVQVGLGGSGYLVAPRTDVMSMTVASGLCREQTAKIMWRVEDYFGAELKSGSDVVTLGPLGKPGAATTVKVVLPPDERTYKVVAWPETDKGRGPESWGYIGRRDCRTDFRAVRLLDKGWDFAQALGVKQMKPPAPKDDTVEEALEVALGDPDKEALGIDGAAMDPFSWQKVSLPHMLREEQRKAHRMWYRTNLAVPADMAGKRITLWFYSVSYQVDVFVGNEFIGRRPMWELPGEVDLTGKVKPGSTNMLWLGVTDYIAAQDPAEQAKAVDGRNNAYGLLGPVNGFPFMKHSGIPSVPELRAYPLDARLDWVGVESVVDLPRKAQRLKGMVRVANATAADKPLTVQAEVLLRGKPVKTLPPQSVTVKGNSVAETLIEADFPEGQCWTLDSPTLYQLRTQLLDGGKVVDQTDTRFGFRQFGTDGRSITLNGFPIRIMGSDQWRPHTNPRLRGTVDMVRLSPSIEQCLSHCVGGGELDVYDETGCLVLADDLDSNACTRNNWAWEDGRLYKNIAAKFRSLIGDLYNHPSIVIWAWGCEFPFYCGGRISDAAVKMACEAEADVQKADPTRFASFTSLGRGRGFSRSRLLSTHSEAPDPGEYVTTGLWYYRSTNDVPEYLRELIGRQMMESGSYGYLSEKDRKQSRFWDGIKPVFNCETGYTGYDCDTDDQLACTLPGGFWMRSGAWFESEVARGNFYRLGQTWTRGFAASTHCAEGAGEEKLARAAVFPQYWEDKYWGGLQTNLPIFVVNNYLWPEDLRMTWGLYAQDGRKLGGGEKSWAMAPSCVREDSLPLDLPPVKEAEYVRLIYSVESKTGGLEYRGWERLTSFPACDLKAASKDLKIGVYDPAGGTAEALKNARVDFDLLKKPDDNLAGYRLLIIGENAVDETVGQARETLRKAVSEGLTCAIWFQDRKMTNFPMTVSRGADISGFAYLTHPQHPLVKGLLHSDFRWWRNPSHDHLVLIHSVGVPVSENARRIVSGALTEVPLGKGRFISYQFPLVRDLTVEPAAARLVDNLLAMARTPPPPTPGRQLYALAADMGFVSGWAKRIGVTVKPFPPSDPSQAVLLAQGQSLLPMTDGGIQSFLNNGGILWMTGVDTNKAGSSGKAPVTLDTPEEQPDATEMLEAKLDPVSWLAKILGIRVEVKKLKAPLPDEVGTERRAFLKQRVPVLEGIAGCDLGWDVGETTLTLAEPDFQALLEPSFFVARKFGKGTLLLDNLRWPSVPGGRSDFLFFQLAWNLGLRSVTVSGRKGEPGAALESLDAPLQGIAPLPETK